jgi:hypothetical protein
VRVAAAYADSVVFLADGRVVGTMQQRRSERRQGDSADHGRRRRRLGRGHRRVLAVLRHLQEQV